MAALSDYAEKLLLDWMMTNGSATRPTAWYVALYTAAPSDSGGGTEVSGNGYSRQAVTFDAASTPVVRPPILVLCRSLPQAVAGVPFRTLVSSTHPPRAICCGTGL